jgi:L-asparaginase II
MPVSDPNPVLVDVLRGGAVESAHRGALAIADARGRLLLSLGDCDRPVFPRSAVKVMQALPLVASGAADALGLTEAELALACASHNGEPLHVATAASMLAKAGLDVSALACGTHWPYAETATRRLLRDDAAPSALHNNCSGKHAGFACLGCHRAGGPSAPGRQGWLAGYVRPDHALMREVTAALASVTGHDLEATPRGTDGCSIPTYAVPLHALATGFARIASGDGLSPEHAAAATRLRRAVASAPFMVAGTGRFDTRVMERLGERVFCKVGAEGVYGAALPDRGLGIAVKCDDGNTARACEAVMAAVIAALVALDDAERDFIGGLADQTLRNWNGLEVGALRATAALRDALATAASRV